MFVGILFTVVVSLMIGFFSSLAFYMRTYVVSRWFADTEVRLFCHFWLTMAAVWYMTAAVDFFRYLQEDVIALGAVYLLQIFVGLSLVIAAQYFESVFFGGRRRKPVIAAYSVFYALFLFSLFWFGTRTVPQDFFAAQILTSRLTLTIFTVGFLPLWFASLYDFFATIWQKIKRDGASRQFHTLGSLAFILIGIAGSLDEMGIVSGWTVTVVRLVTLVAAMLAYFGISSLTEPEEMVI